MQEPTEQTKKITAVQLTTTALNTFDPRNIIFVLHLATGKEQYIEYYLLEKNKLQGYRVERQADSVTFLYARELLAKHHELFDEIYLEAGLYIHVKKFVEPYINSKNYRLAFTMQGKRLYGPTLTKSLTEALSFELGRREIYTTDLCSIDFLNNKIYTHKIIRKYLGEIGLKYYRQAKVCGTRSIFDCSFQRLAQQRRRTDLYPFIAELNQVPIMQLIEAKFTDEIAKLDANKSDYDLERFIYSRYYYSLINDRETRLLLAIIRLLTKPVEQLEELFAPDHWVDAINHVRFARGEYFIVDDEQRQTNELSYNYYRARYILGRVGRTKLKSFLNNFFSISKLSQNVGTFSAQLSALIEDDVDKLFIDAKSPVLTELKFRDCDEIFKYPILADFEENALTQILENIRTLPASRMTDTRLRGIAYFFANYWFISINHNPVEAFDAAANIIQNAPRDSLASSQAIIYADDVLCVLCRAVNHTPLKGDFDARLHDLFWPFLNNNIKFVENYQHTEFINSFHETILDEALDWELYLSNLDQINPELDKYLLKTGQTDVATASKNCAFDIYQAAVCHHARTKSAKDRFEYFLDHDEELLNLYYADSEDIEDAKLLIPHLISSKCKIESKCELLESYAINGKNSETFNYCAKYLADNLDTMIKNFYNSTNASGQYWAVRIFTAFCEGACSSENAKVLDYFAEKLSVALIKSGKAHEFDSYLGKINLAFKAALKNIRTESRLRTRVIKSLPAKLKRTDDAKVLK